MGEDKVASVFILLTVAILPIAASSLENSPNNNTDGEFISKVVRTLAEFCPHQDLAAMDNNTGRTDTGSCCTEFFYSNDTNFVTNQDLAYAAEPFQKCIFVQTEEPELFTPTISYHVVVDAPPGGCLAQIYDHESLSEEEEKLFEPRCDDDVAPWRRLFPVFSKSSRLIYKTPNCAYCHGVRDLIYWSPTVVCEGQIPSFTSNMSTCDVFFDYPGNRNDVKDLQCFTNAFETCRLENNDKLSQDISLTKNELRQACNMDTLPPFNHMVHSKNLFCYMCNYRGSYFPVQSCRTYNMDDNKHSIGSDAFIGLINTDSLRRLDEAAPTAESNAACINVNNETECHPVRCPIGQSWVRRGKERECAFDLVKWERAGLKAIIVLTSDASITINTADLETILTERQLKSPWLRGWKISSLSRKVAELPENTTRPDNTDVINVPVNPEGTATNQLLVHLDYAKASFNPKDELQEVAKAMKKPWTLNFHGERIVFKQRMSRYKLTRMLNIAFAASRQFFIGPMWHGMRYDAPVPIGPMPIFEVVGETVDQARPTNYINDLFFCQQIELQASYFTVFRHNVFHFSVLYNTATGYLFDNEFHHIERSTGQSYFRVCVYSVMNQETSVSTRPMSHLLTFKFSLLYLAFTVMATYWLHSY